MPEDNQRLLQAIRVGNIGIFEHDHQADSIFWSPELREMYGWDAEEPASLSKIVAHVYPEDVGRVIALVQRAHDPAGDGMFDIEHRIVDRRGTVRWVQTRSQTHFGNVAGKMCPTRTIGAVQDVTQRRIADERLRVLDAVLSSSAQAIAIADAQGALTFANAALRRLWGHDDEAALLGRSLFEFWRTEQEPAAALEQIRLERARTVELLAARVDGARFYLEVTAEAVCDADGALAQVLVTFTDITLRKRLESQLSHAQKMESIGRLAGGVAHDFNNMLTVILGGIELSLPRLDAEHPSRVYLRDAAEAAQSAAALTRQLLAFSRKEVIAPRALDLNETIERMQKMILRLLGEDVRLVTVCGRELPPISFDPVQIEQVILNLAVNARDAMATGGQLTLETSCIRPGASELSGLRDGGVLLTVSDNGQGITDEVRAHLFEPFFTTKEPGKGTGLGLAMVYGAVQQNGGHIEVDSEPGKGATFKIYLPPTTATAVRPPVLKAPVLSPPTRRAAILLVEDHTKVAAFAKTVLDGLGHVVHAFSDAESALQALPALSPSPDILITDLVMPGADGRTLAAHATARLPGLRVLFVSGYAHDVMAARGMLADGVELLAKPYSAGQLAARVRELLAEPS